MLWLAPVPCLPTPTALPISAADTVTAVEELSPSQRQLRSHIETGIALASPVLDAVLAIGERISRLAEPRDYEYYPVRESSAPEANGARPGNGGATTSRAGA